MADTADPVRARLRRAYLSACAWDVAVPKPGNVSWRAAGHRMQASMFIASAEASAAALTEPGAGVGARILAAVTATQARVGCNTNLGIVLLCAPTAAAFERAARAGPTVDEAALRSAWREVRDALTVDDARQAHAAIALARPAGLGRLPEHDVAQPPRLDLRASMALAADRDRIARQYRDAAEDLFDFGQAVLRAPAGQRDALAREPGHPADVGAARCVRDLYLAFLASAPDSHIVRKHGPELAHSVLRQAASWRLALAEGDGPAAEQGLADWDDALKRQAINPGTSADLTVATLMLTALLA